MQVNTTYSDIWKMAYPAMIGSIAVAVLNVTDTIFLGRVGEVALGASALGGVFYFVIVMIGLAMATGTQIQIARRAGEKNHSAIGGIFDQSLYLFLAMSVIGFVTLKFLSGPMFRVIVREEELRNACFNFLKYRSFGIFFAMMAMSIRSFYVGIAMPKIWSVYSAILAVLNIILCYALVFGHFGLPAMGVAGAGLASSVSELIGLIYLVIYTVAKPGFKQFNLFRFGSLNMETITKTMTLSGPLVVQNLISTGAWFVFFVFIEKMGKHSLAISNITRSAYMVIGTPIWGFSTAANSMVSNVIGQGRKGEVMGMINRILLMAVGLASCIILTSMLLSGQMLGIFSNDAALVHDSLGPLLVIDFATFVFSFAIVCISSVSGTGATRTALYIEVAAIILYLLYLYLVIFVFRASLEWAWGAEALYWIFTGAVCYLYLKSMRWEKIVL